MTMTTSSTVVINKYGNKVEWRHGEWISVNDTSHAEEPKGSREHIHDACIVEAKAGEPPDNWAWQSARNNQPSPRLETDSTKRKDVPIYSVLFRYFPDAIAEIARLAKAGNDKHNPGEPLHWSRGKSSDHLDCIARHMVDAGTTDSEGFLHDTNIAIRSLMNLQVTLERVRGLPISPGSKK